MTDHKPVTDAEAENAQEELNWYVEKSLKTYKMPPDPRLVWEFLLRLLRDRDVAMEIIEILLKNHTASDFHYQQPYCVHCHSSWDDEFIKDDRAEENHDEGCIVLKARALIASVRGEE